MIISSGACRYHISKFSAFKAFKLLFKYYPGVQAYASSTRHPGCCSRLERSSCPLRAHGPATSTSQGILRQDRTRRFKLWRSDCDRETGRCRESSWFCRAYARLFSAVADYHCAKDKLDGGFGLGGQSTDGLLGQLQEGRVARRGNSPGTV